MKNKIYATNARILFFKAFNVNFPKVSVTPVECSLFSAFEYVDYSQSENYNTYKFQDTIYGFIQPADANGFNYQSIISKFTKQNYISIKIQDFINFCTSTIAFATSGLIKKRRF